MFFFFLLFTLVAAHTREYVHTCLLSIDPYSSSNSPDFMIFSASTCLSRAYIAFPTVFEEPERLTAPDQSTLVLKKLFRPLRRIWGHQS